MSREMVNSGIPWVGDIPKGWETATLLQVLRCRISDGPHETPNLVDNGIPFISVDSLNESEDVDFNIVRKFISEEDYNVYSKKTYLEIGDILFTKSATIGKTAIVKSDRFMIWSPIAILKPNHLIQNKFLYHLVSNGYFKDYVCQLSTFNTQFNIGMRTLEKAKICFPPLSEQQKIASFLDRKCAEIDEMIALQEKIVEELKAYKQSVITEAVTKGLNPDVPMKDSGIEWIGEIPEHWTTIRIKYLLGERKERSVHGEEEPLSMSQKYGLIPTKEMDVIPNMASSFEGAKIVYVNDLVFNKLKAHLGVFSTSNHFGLVSPDYAVYYGLGRALMPFMEFMFKTPQYISEFRKTATGVGSGLTRLYTSDLFSMPFPLPSIEEQAEIVKFLEEKRSQIDNLISIKLSKIDSLKEYKKSIIYEYVTGKKEVIE